MLSGKKIYIYSLSSSGEQWKILDMFKSSGECGVSFMTALSLPHAWQSTSSKLPRITMSDRGIEASEEGEKTMAE